MLITTVTCNMYVIVHTMTIKGRDYVVHAHYFHALHGDRNGRAPPTTNAPVVHSPSLVTRTVTVTVTLTCRSKSRGCYGNKRLYDPPTLKKALMKKNPAYVKHSLRTFHVYARNCGQAAINAAPIVPKPRAESKSPSPLSPSKLDSNSGEKNLEAVVINGTKGVTAEHVDNINSPVLQQQQQQLTTNTDPSEASRWLLANRFESHLVGFSSFSGADLLRMSREDLMQVCGPPDGIRLYNTLHQNRWMEPALTVYVARSRAAAYHAIYLRSLSTNELQAKLSTYLSLCADSERISAIYMQGPQGIHVHLDDSLLRCIKHESIFSVAILHSNAGNAGNAHNADNTNIGKNVVNVAILLKPEFNVANDHVNNVNVNVKGMSHSH